MVFRGSGTALITPFRKGKVDWIALEVLVEKQVEAAVDALVVCGTTGEPSTMSLEEQLAVTNFVLKHASGIPVIAGIGGNNTDSAIRRARVMQALGVDGLLAVTPYYNKTTQAGLYAHYTAIADAVTKPIVLYNVPSRTGLNLLPTTTAQLAEHENIVALKEANPDMGQIMEDFRLAGDKIAIYSGNDDLVYPFLTLGGAGVISVASNLIPRVMQDMTARFFAGDWKGSLALQQDYMPLFDLLFAQVSPLPIKAAMARVGLIANDVRLPLLPLTDAEAAPLYEELAQMGIG